MTTFLRASLVLVAVATFPALALAKGGTPQNHHCMKDGAELTGKTKKECKQSGGKWDKLPEAAKDTKDTAPKTTP